MKSRAEAAAVLGLHLDFSTNTSPRQEGEGDAQFDCAEYDFTCLVQ